jgi:hypothetical protein
MSHGIQTTPKKNGNGNGNVVIPNGINDVLDIHNRIPTAAAVDWNIFPITNMKTVMMRMTVMSIPLI